MASARNTVQQLEALAKVNPELVYRLWLAESHLRRRGITSRTTALR